MYKVQEGAVDPLLEQRGVQKRSLTDLFALTAVLAFVALVCFGQSAMKHYWYDEIVTVRVAADLTTRQIIDFFQSGKDTTSFIPPLLVRAFQRLPGSPEIVWRIPFMLAYLGACALTWIFLRRRYPAGYATAALLLFAQGPSLYYASEARAYAFVLLGAAVAMVCWQSALDEIHSLLAAGGVFAGLALAILFHAFAIFLVVPFLVAEWFFWRQHGRLRISMLLAVLVSPATLALMLPTVIHARKLYGHSFFSKPNIGQLTDCYTLFLDPVGRGLGEIIVLIAFFLLAAKSLLQRSSGSAATASTEGFSRIEWVFLIALSVVPFVAYLGAKIMGAFRVPYVIYFQIGLLVLLLGALAELLHRNTRAGWAFAGLLFLLCFMHDREMIRQGVHEATGRPVMLFPNDYTGDWWPSIQGNSLPVVADSTQLYLDLNFYAPAALKPRLTTLTTTDRTRLLAQSATFETNMEVFRDNLGYRTEDCDAFLASHKQFLLVVNPTWVHFSWLFAYLVHRSETQHDVQLEVFYQEPGSDNTNAVYLVHVGAPPPQIVAQTTAASFAEAR